MLDPNHNPCGFGQKRSVDLRHRLQFAMDQVSRSFHFGYAEHAISVPKCLRYFKWAHPFGVRIVLRGHVSPDFSVSRVANETFKVQHGSILVLLSKTCELRVSFIRARAVEGIMTQNNETHPHCANRLHTTRNCTNRARNHLE